MMAKRRMAFNRVRALTIGCALSLMAAAGWSQQASLTWLGTLPGGGLAAGRTMFQPTAPWWSAGLPTPLGICVPFAGRRLVECRTSARWAVVLARLMAFRPMARSSSAGLRDAAWQSACLSLDGCWRNASPRHAWSGYTSYAYGVSADGSVVVGVAYTNLVKYHAFRWTESEGMQDLGTLGGWGSAALGVSADGSVVVGYAYDADEVHRAFRWTAESGMEDLGTLGGGWSRAYSVSADGSVVVGMARNSAGHIRAFRWTAESGMQDLGTLGGFHSTALGVSADGTVVVGWADSG
jgi:probable HAF family extracellular repeat protein